MIDRRGPTKLDAPRKPSLTCGKALIGRGSFHYHSPLQRRGRRFEPVTAHHANDQVNGCFQSLMASNRRSNRREIQQKSNIRTRFASGNQLPKARNPTNPTSSAPATTPWGRSDVPLSGMMRRWIGPLDGLVRIRSTGCVVGADLVVVGSRGTPSDRSRLSIETKRRPIGDDEPRALCSGIESVP
jgi:hypothetical protein